MKKKNIILIFIAVVVVVICILAVVIGFGLSDRKDNNKSDKKNPVNLVQDEPDGENESESKQHESKPDETDEITQESSFEENTTEEESTSEEESTYDNETTTEEETTIEEETTTEEDSAVKEESTTAEESTTQVEKQDLNRYSYEYMMIDGQTVYSEYNVKIMELFNCINAERQQAGLSPLTFDKDISYVACARASQLAFENVLESDEKVKYYDIMKQCGISFSKAVENIAAGYENAQEVVSGNGTSWKTSQKHYDNIVSVNYTRVGVGVDYSDTMGYVWVAIFSN